MDGLIKEYYSIDRKIDRVRSEMKDEARQYKDEIRRLNARKIEIKGLIDSGQTELPIDQPTDTPRCVRFS